jgi:hypothetical protein
VLIATVMMAVGAFGPWLAGRLSRDSAGVTLGGDGWILVLAALMALAPSILGISRGLVGVWLLANAAVGGLVCLVHFHQAETDGFKYGWGLYLGTAGCAVLAVAALQWLVAAARPA